MWTDSLLVLRKENSDGMRGIGADNLWKMFSLFFFEQPICVLHD